MTRFTTAEFLLKHLQPFLNQSIEKNEAVAQYNECYNREAVSKNEYMFSKGGK